MPNNKNYFFPDVCLHLNPFVITLMHLFGHCYIFGNLELHSGGAGRHAMSLVLFLKINSFVILFLHSSFDNILTSQVN